MGAGASGLSHDTPGGAVRLPASGLRVSHSQLRALNTQVHQLYEEDRKGRMSLSTESYVQSVVQRLVDGAGQRDPRYRCCHLVALHQGKMMRSRSLEYLVTLDALPPLNAGDEGECGLQEGPGGYGKVRLGGRSAELWQEFLTPQGYLCRDKVLERWVQLIARCATARGGGGCRVLGPIAAQRAEPYHYCYLERASPSQSAPDRRLAIVQGAAWVLVRCGAGGAAGAGGRGEAKLMLGLRVGGASAAAYTSRVPLSHPMALVHYTAAMQGYYAVCVPPPAALVCAERPATWQLWHPALEVDLDSHCSDTSPITRIAGALNALIDRMRDGNYQGSLNLLSRYAAWCALRRRVDRCGAYPQAAARCVASSHVAHHLLMVLDSLYSVCERGGVAGYVYRVERESVVRRGSVSGGQWGEDAACLRNCLLELVQIAGEDIPPSPSESLETALLGRWERLLKEWRGAASAGPTPGYSRRQLRYLWRAAQQLLAYKNLIHADLPGPPAPQERVPLERLVHILAVMLDQARDLYLNALHSPQYGHFDRDTSNYRSNKWLKLQQYYDASSACLVDAVRRDPELRGADLTDGADVIKQILKWLQKGAKEDGKYLCPVLKPYLEGLFAASLENCWLLDDFDANKCEEEFIGLRAYCFLVHGDKADPCMALLDAAKQYCWAKAMVDVVDRFKHIEFRLVFPTGEGMAVSYPVRLPSRRERGAARTLTLSRGDKAEAKLRLARRCVLAAFTDALAGDCCQKPHISRQSSEDILVSAKSGNYWRLSRPDLIPTASVQDRGSVSSRGSRGSRPATAYGFPEICVTSQSDSKTLRRKYHTLRSLVYKEPVEVVKELRRRPRSAGGSVRSRALSRPSLMETLDFINSVKDALCVEESGVSDTEESVWSVEDEQLVGQLAPLNLLAGRAGGRGTHWTLGGLVPTLLTAGKFSVLQELCPYLGDAGEGVLFALHRLARAARSKSSDRAISSWRLPELEGAPSDPPQRYRPRPSECPSEDEQPLPPPQPPPLPRRSSREKMTKRYSDYTPPKRLQDLEQHLEYLEKVSSRLNLNQNQPKPLHDSYTGIINPIYDIKMPKDKFSVKRSKSLGRSFSTKSLGLEITRYNITLGRQSGQKTNDVITAINGMSGQTGVEGKSNYFQRNTDNVVGDSYKVSRVTID